MVSSSFLFRAHIKYLIDMESYVHRIGRTGRAGKKGLAVSFFVTLKNGRLAKDLIETLNRTNQVIPTELQNVNYVQSNSRSRRRF